MFSNQKVVKPELFQMIEGVDELLGLLSLRKVVPFGDYREAKVKRRAYTKAAEEFIKRQKGSS